jgi:hypothetical protein
MHKVNMLVFTLVVALVASAIILAATEWLVRPVARITNTWCVDDVTGAELPPVYGDDC